MSIVSSFEGEQRKPAGAVLFTGPDGVGDYKVKVEEQGYIGRGTASPEASSDTLYLCRAAPDCPHPPPKTARVGEVGWGVPKLSDHSLLKTDNQIKLKEFRQAVEDRHTHLYQTPYYPPPISQLSTITNGNHPGGTSNPAPSSSVQIGTKEQLTPAQFTGSLDSIQSSRSS